jgi:hypothetical protein
MFKKRFYQGIAAGALASVAALLYNRIYFFALEANFSKLVNPGSLIAANVLACMLAALGYVLLEKWAKNRAEVMFNILFSVASFGSILLPFAAKLPLDIQNPELFPGLTVPMHFFPALAWHTLAPLFHGKSSSGH